MSTYRLDNRKKSKERPITEQDCMIKFYEPFENKQKILKKWLMKPER
jgi:hypothetical protein